MSDDAISGNRSVPTRTFDQASPIAFAERDSEALHNANWPLIHEIPDGWSVGGGARPEVGYLEREVISGAQKLSAPILDTMIRFPCAPIFGINRKQDYQYKLPSRLNYQTIRVLRRPCSNDKPLVKRIFLFHNGLNEIDNIGFYLKLADYLLDDETACLIHAFPGHLTRYPLKGDYAERPLDRYLNDAGDLYRQFLRYMLESQWLLTILVPLRTYRVATGLDLLAEGDEGNPGRSDDDRCADAIHEAWKKAAEQSPEELRGQSVDRDGILRSVKTIRHLIGWQKDQCDFTRPPKIEKLRPILHAVGYSLGGFVAQSVFFTWPFAVASCTSLFSGGTLAEVTPTAFAHPEEWQSVIHSLKYEVKGAMLGGRIKFDQSLVAGVKREYFAFFDRIFTDVFVQDLRGPYRSRLAEYLTRILFVLGGGDPIVSTRSVMDSAPPDGMNLIQVSKVAHFPWERIEQWNEFWLPQAARVIRAFATETEAMLGRILASGWWLLDRSGLVSSE